MTNAGVNGYPASAAGGPVPDGSIAAAKLAAPLGFGKMVSGYYYFTSGGTSTATNNGLGTGTLRLLPWVVPNACTLSSIGAEVQSGGDSGSKFRIGIFADAGWGYPGRLVLDAGTIAGDSATVQEIAINQALSAGLYWVGGAVQVVTTTQPTMRTASSTSAVLSCANFAIAATPTSNQTIGGYQQTSVTGVLPAVFTTTVTGGGAGATRVFVKVA